MVEGEFGSNEGRRGLGAEEGVQGSDDKAEAPDLATSAAGDGEGGGSGPVIEHDEARDRARPVMEFPNGEPVVEEIPAAGKTEFHTIRDYEVAKLVKKRSSYLRSAWGQISQAQMIERYLRDCGVELTDMPKIGCPQHTTWKRKGRSK